MLRSVTQLTKQSDNDLTGAAAEAFSGNATPCVSQPTRFFTNWRTNSSNSIVDSNLDEPPPSYHQDSQLEGRRRSEGSIFSASSSPRREGASSTQSSSRPSLQISRTSFFSTGASSSASTLTTTTSFSAIAFPSRPSKEQHPQQRPSWSQRRRSSGQFSAAARQALQTSQAFFGIQNGISEHHAIAAAKPTAGPPDSSKSATDHPGDAQQQQQQQQKHASQPLAEESATKEQGFKAAVMPTLTNVESDLSDPSGNYLHSRQALIPTAAGGGGGHGEIVKPGVKPADSAAGADAAAEHSAEVVVDSSMIPHASSRANLQTQAQTIQLQLQLQLQAKLDLVVRSARRIRLKPTLICQKAMAEKFLPVPRQEQSAMMLRLHRCF